MRYPQLDGVTMTLDLQPDQIPARWDDHVDVYERVFEPFSLALAAPVFERLRLVADAAVIDVGAGPGGAALRLAQSGARVTAIDASAAMVKRIEQRARAAGVCVDARQMDAGHLGFADASFDAAISVFGIVLLPDAAGALREMRRVVRPGGCIAVVTWTEPQSYELAALLNAAADDVWPERPRTGLPAQLRYREPQPFEQLFADAGLPAPRIERAVATLTATSASWLAERLSFAPGMESMLNGLGARRAAVLDRFVARLEARSGDGEIMLSGVAFVGSCNVGRHVEAGDPPTPRRSRPITRI